jgi:hypothetical protein
MQVMAGLAFRRFTLFAANLGRSCGTGRYATASLPYPDNQHRYCEFYHEFRCRLMCAQDCVLASVLYSARVEILGEGNYCCFSFHTNLCAVRFAMPNARFLIGKIGIEETIHGQSTEIALTVQQVTLLY